MNFFSFNHGGPFSTPEGDLSFSSLPRGHHILDIYLFFFFPTHLIVLVPAAYRQRVYSPVSCANLFLMWKLLGSEKTLRRLKSAPQLFRLILHEHKCS